MLILTRHLEEKIIINDEIIVKVLEIDENKVRLGVIAPKDIPIRRGENETPTDKKE